MPKLVELNIIEHANLSIDESAVPGLGKRERLVPVVLSEFQKLVVDYPIVLTKNNQDGGFLPVALLGYSENENLFWRNNKWQSIYLPLNIQRQPFFLDTDSSESPISCIDLNSSCLHRGVNEKTSALFEGVLDGPYLKNIKSMLSALVAGEQDNISFIECMTAHQLIMPLTLDISLGSGEKVEVRGLYTIDEEQLNKLNKDVLFELAASGYLKVIYLMLASLSHIYSLIELKNSLLSEAQKPGANSP
jgi:hypothetical protein